MAEGPTGGKGGEAFEILGRIVVDVAALKKSLGEAEGAVKATSERINRDLNKTRLLPGGGFSEGGPGGLGPGGGGGEGGGRSAMAEFAHGARIVRHEVAPVVSALNASLGQFISAGSQAARTAVFFGAKIGGIAIAGAIASSVLSKYIEAAKASTAAQLELDQAVKTMDVARVSAQIVKLDEAVAAFNIEVRNTRESTQFWPQFIGHINQLVESMTGATEENVAKLKKAFVTLAELTQTVTVPKGLIETDKVEAELDSKRAARAVKYAADEASRTVALDRATAAIKRGSGAEADRIKFEGDQEEKTLRKRADEMKKFAENRIKSENAKADAFRSVSEMESGVFIDDEEEKKVRAKEELDKEYADIDAKTSAAILGLHNETTRKLSDNSKKLAESLEADADARFEAEAKAATEREQFAQRDIAREKSRVESTLTSEKAIADVRREQRFLVEGESQMEQRLAALRKASVQAEQEAYESKRRALEAQPDTVKSRQEIADLDNQHRADVASNQRKFDAQEAQERERRAQQEFETRKQYADAYFRYYQSLGVSTWQAQLESAKSVLSTTEQGTKRWFDAVGRVADVYKGIHDQAKGILQQQLAITRESMAREATGPRTSIAAIERDVRRQRQIDERVLSSGRGTRAQLSGAVGRQDMFRTMDREGLTPQEALRRATQDPQAQMREALHDTGTRMGALSTSVVDLSEKFDNLGRAADDLAAKLGGRGWGGGPGGEVQPISPHILPSQTGMTGKELSAELDSQLGRNLQLSTRRGLVNSDTVLP